MPFSQRLIAARERIEQSAQTQHVAQAAKRPSARTADRFAARSHECPCVLLERNGLSYQPFDEIGRRAGLRLSRIEHGLHHSHRQIVCPQGTERGSRGEQILAAGQRQVAQRLAGLCAVPLAERIGDL